MPSLDRYPDDALLDTIRDLRRQLDEVRNLRKRPSPCCKVYAAGSPTFSSPFAQIVPVNTLIYDSGIFDAAGFRVVYPSAGLYLHTLYVPALTGVAQVATVRLTYSDPPGLTSDADAVWPFVTSSAEATTFTQIGVREAGAWIKVALTLPSHTASQTGGFFTLAVERLHDAPDLS